MKITAFTDGSAVASGKNKGLGGFGAVICEGEKERYFSKGYSNTKTGRMEIMALLCVLNLVSDNVSLLVYSDSQYVVNAFNKFWLKKWQKENWIKSTGEEVKNKDLWKKIQIQLDLKPNLRLIMQHIKGHQIDKAQKSERANLLTDPIIRGNAKADLLADYKRHKKYTKDE